MKRAAHALGREDGPSALYDLMLKAANDKSLRKMGLTRAALEKAADLAVGDAHDNAGLATRDEILEMLLGAYEGLAPRRQ
jgi:hypothetical protein